MNIMMAKHINAGAVTVAMLLSGITAASAAHIDPADVQVCKGEIALVRTETDLNTEFLSRNNPTRDEASLLSKLDDATTKLNQAIVLLGSTNKHNTADGKIDDARDKLLQFRQKVIDLRDAPKQKISDDDAAELLSLVDTAIACLDGL